MRDRIMRHCSPVNGGGLWSKDGRDSPLHGRCLASYSGMIDHSFRELLLALKDYIHPVIQVVVSLVRELRCAPINVHAVPAVDARLQGVQRRIIHAGRGEIARVVSEARSRK